MLSSYLRRIGAAQRTPIRRTNRSRVNLLTLEERAVPAAGQIAYAVGSAAGIQAVVKIYDDTGAVLKTFNPYGTFGGGVRVAVADFTGDGVLDIVTGAGPGGGSHVQIFDGAAALLDNFRPIYSKAFVYPTNFTGGTFVAAGDINGDGHEDLIVGPGVGKAVNPGRGNDQPTVFAFDINGANATTNPILAQFNAYTSDFTGGVSVAASDVGGDNGGTPGGIGDDEIVTGSGLGGGSHVEAWDYVANSTQPQLFLSIAHAYDVGFTGGVYVAAGRFTNNFDDQGFIYSDIATGPGTGGGPVLRVFSTDLADLPVGTGQNLYQTVMARSHNVFDSSTRSGLTLAGAPAVDHPVTPNPDAGNGLAFVDTILIGMGPPSVGQPKAAVNSAVFSNAFATLDPRPTPSELIFIGTEFAFTFDPAFLGGTYPG